MRSAAELCVSKYARHFYRHGSAWASIRGRPAQFREQRRVRHAAKALMLPAGRAFRAVVERTEGLLRPYHMGGNIILLAFY
jgi:hypothetical protein